MEADRTVRSRWSKAVTKPARTYADLRSEIHTLEDEVERLQALLEAKVTPGYEFLATRLEKQDADNVRLRAAVEQVRKIIVDAAEVGFNCHDGDWASRLFASQATTYAALRPLPHPKGTP